MPDEIPPFLESSLRGLDDALGQLRTRLIPQQIEIPDSEPPDPKDLPPQLKAVAAAVAEGRTTWENVASGQGIAHIPEVKDLYGASGPRIEQGIAQAEAELAARQEAERKAAEAAARRARQGPSHEDDDNFGEQTIMRRDHW